MGKILERYKDLKRSSLTNDSLKKYKYILIVMTVVLGINYILAFFPVYNHLFDILNKNLFDAYSYISPAVVDIRRDMYANGDIELFEKYFVFAIFNVGIIMFVVMSSFFVFGGERDRNYSFRIGIYFLYVLFGVMFAFSMISFFNGAGYNDTRFPINPLLGKGVFFFSRDSFFIFAVGANAIELVVMIFLMSGYKYKGLI